MLKSSLLGCYFSHMKPCRVCHGVKPVDQFNYADRKTGRRKTLCRTCQYAQQRKHYAENKAQYLPRIARNTKAAANRRRMILREMKAQPCADCGVSYPYFVMDFDHRPGEVKVFGVAQHLHRYRTEPELRAEIAKCDVVCANCHRFRTHGRREVAGEGIEPSTFGFSVRRSAN